MNGPHVFAVADEHGLNWRLCRNCSVSPRQLGALYASLCCISAVISVGFWMHGASLVAPFAALELLAVGIAFLMYARHAADGERIRLVHGQLEVTIQQAGTVTRAVFPSHAVRIQAPTAPGALIAVSALGQTLQLGRHVRPEVRPQLARELTCAVRANP